MTASDLSSDRSKNEAIEIYAEFTPSKYATACVVNRALLPEDVTDDDIRSMMRGSSVIYIADSDAVQAAHPICLALYLPRDALSVLKEVAMAADRASATPEVKALAWEIFQALDKLPADVRDISNEL